MSSPREDWLAWTRRTLEGFVVALNEDRARINSRLAAARQAGDAIALAAPDYPML